MFLNKGMLELLIVKYKIIPHFCLSAWIVKKIIPWASFYGNRNIFRYILLSFHEFHVSAFLGLIRDFKIYDGKTSLVMSSSSLITEFKIYVAYN